MLKYLLEARDNGKPKKVRDVELGARRGSSGAAYPPLDQTACIHSRPQIFTFDDGSMATFQWEKFDEIPTHQGNRFGLRRTLSDAT